MALTTYIDKLFIQAFVKFRKSQFALIDGFTVFTLVKVTQYHRQQRHSLLGTCDIDFYNFRHLKVQNFETLNQFKRHQNFTVIF